jgi:hypothetical protein
MVSVFGGATRFTIDWTTWLVRRALERIIESQDNHAKGGGLFIRSIKRSQPLFQPAVGGY